jgi:hypothetical protein
MAINTGIVDRPYQHEAIRRVAEADLYEAPLTVFGRNAVDRYFSPAEVRDIRKLTEKLAA